MKDGLAFLGIGAIATGLGQISIPIAVIFVGIVVITIAVFWGFVEQRQKGVADEGRRRSNRSGDTPSG